MTGGLHRLYVRNKQGTFPNSCINSSAKLNNYSMPKMHINFEEQYKPVAKKISSYSSCVAL